MRRFCKRGSPVGLFLLITFFYPLLAPPAHRIDEAHFEQITVGMSLEDVESRFGAPAGSYDWAVPDNAISFFPPALALIVRAPSRIHTSIVSEVVVARASNDAMVCVLSNSQPSQLNVNRVVLTVNYLASNSRTWTSRHGTCTIHFDENNRVVVKSGWGKTHLEPPWHNWRNWFSK